MDVVEASADDGFLFLGCFRARTIRCAASCVCGLFLSEQQGAVKGKTCFEFARCFVAVEKVFSCETPVWHAYRVVIMSFDTVGALALFQPGIAGAYCVLDDGASVLDLAFCAG